MKLRVAFAGTPAFAVPALRALAAAHEAVGALTQPDRPAGRGRALSASAVKQAALALGLPVAQPERLRGDAAGLRATLDLLSAWRPDVLVVVAYGLILPRALLEMPRLGCLNIHASLLPRWRGAAPIQRAILAGDTETGVSIMQMDEGLDTGGVLCAARLAIGAECTAARLHDELAALGAAQILVAIDGAARGTLVAQPQPTEGVTHAGKLSRAEARIDWTQGAVQIDRQVRAFNPWPTAETTLDAQPVKLWRSRAPTRPAPTGATPGTLLGLAGDALEIACGTGVLQVMELQRAGRKAVAARDFLNAVDARDGRAAVFQ
ncbi:MAG TPA: methionyl-tRNA formyltransferase [Steroidobacteraceae bacterium]|nr:methionyl-tRNA formyltransferase [Steroidobacteraceae bacterium]